MTVKSSQFYLPADLWALHTHSHNFPNIFIFTWGKRTVLIHDFFSFYAPLMFTFFLTESAKIMIFVLYLSCYRSFDNFSFFIYSSIFNIVLFLYIIYYYIKNQYCVKFLYEIILGYICIYYI